MKGVIQRNLVQGWFYSRHSFTRAKAAGSYITLSLKKISSHLIFVEQSVLTDVKSE